MQSLATRQRRCNIANKKYLFFLCGGLQLKKKKPVDCDECGKLRSREPVFRNTTSRTLIFETLIESCSPLADSPMGH
jgi:hypothetical protein